MDDFARHIDDYRNRLTRAATAIFNGQTLNRWLQTAGRLTLSGLDRERSTFDEAVEAMVAQASRAAMPVAAWLRRIERPCLAVQENPLPAPGGCSSLLPIKR